MAKTIASIADGRVVPWFSEDPVPAGFVVVPPELQAKFMDGRIADGVALAKAAIAGEIPQAEKPASKSAAKAAKSSDASASTLFGDRA